MKKQSPTGSPPVVTTKVMAIGHLTEKGLSSTERLPIMQDEVPATVDLYLQGKIDSWYSTTDGPGVVFLMNVSTLEEAHSLLKDLPLAEASMMDFQLVPLGPLNPLRILLDPMSII